MFVLCSRITAVLRGGRQGQSRAAKQGGTRQSVRFFRHPLLSMRRVLPGHSATTPASRRGGTHLTRGPARQDHRFNLREIAGVPVQQRHRAAGLASLRASWTGALMTRPCLGGPCVPIALDRLCHRVDRAEDPGMIHAWG